jgi:hypothetical protein
MRCPTTTLPPRSTSTPHGTVQFEQQQLKRLKAVTVANGMAEAEAEASTLVKAADFVRASQLVKSSAVLSIMS